MITAIIAAIMLPLIAGRLVLAAIVPRRSAREFVIFAETLAWSWLIGSGTLVTLLVLLGLSGMPLTTAATWSTAMLFILLAATAASQRFWSRVRYTAPTDDVTPPPPSGTVSHRLLLYLPLLLIAIRIFFVVAEARLVPEHLTDAYQNWLLRAKVIATLEKIPTDSNSPFRLGGGRVSYPLGTSMLAAWPSLLFDGSVERGDVWNERLCNLAWPIHAMALWTLIGCAITRRCGVLAGVWTVYLATSLPLFSIHAVRTGYADLPMAAHLTAAVLASWRARDERRAAWLVVAAINALICVMLKREGLPYAVIVTLATWMALAVDQNPMRHRYGFLGYLSVALTAYLLGRTADLSYVQNESSVWQFSTDAARIAVVRLFTLDTWNLLWWIVLPAWLVTIWRNVRDRKLLGTLQTAGLLAFLTAVFLFTRNAEYVINGWTFDRSMMHIAPMMLCLIVIEILTPNVRTNRSSAAKAVKVR